MGPPLPAGAPLATQVGLEIKISPDYARIEGAGLETVTLVHQMIMADRLKGQDQIVAWRQESRGGTVIGPPLFSA